MVTTWLADEIKRRGNALVDARRKEIERLNAEDKKESRDPTMMIIGMLALLKKTNGLVSEPGSNVQPPQVLLVLMTTGDVVAGASVCLSHNFRSPFCR